MAISHNCSMQSPLVIQNVVAGVSRSKRSIIADDFFQPQLDRNMSVRDLIPHHGSINLVELNTVRNQCA
jgi:hypothetical protein